MLNVVVGIIGSALLGVIGWAINLNSRVAVLEADNVSLRELITVQFKEITRRLGRIESKLDKDSIVVTED